MTAQPAPKTNQVFQKISLFLKEGKVPDELTLKRIQNEAESIIQNVDAAQGHVLLGALAAINLDYYGCKRHFDNAIKIDSNDATHFMNYAVALGYMNKLDDSYQIIESVLDRFRNNPEFLKIAMGVAINSGNMSEVSSLLASFNKLSPSDKSEEIKSIKEIDGYFIRVGISDNISKKLFGIASNILIENKISSHNCEIIIDDLDIYCWINVNTNVERVVEMNMLLCDELAEHPELSSENTFSISYRAR